jgi:competence protein ComEA
LRTRIQSGRPCNFPALLVFSVALLFAAVAGAQKKPPAKPVNLNTATIEELEQLPGVGPVTAKDIIQFRKKSGPFRSINDLLAIRRISKGRLEKLRPYVTVGPPAPKPHPAPSAPAPPPSKSPSTP